MNQSLTPAVEVTVQPIGRNWVSIGYVEEETHNYYEILLTMAQARNLRQSLDQVKKDQR